MPVVSPQSIFIIIIIIIITLHCYLFLPFSSKAKSHSSILSSCLSLLSSTDLSTRPPLPTLPLPLLTSSETSLALHSPPHSLPPVESPILATEAYTHCVYTFYTLRYYTTTTHARCRTYHTFNPYTMYSFLFKTACYIYICEVNNLWKSYLEETV